MNGQGPSAIHYMEGTRRLDEIASNARQLAYQEDYSYTEGWDDNTVGTIANLGLNLIYDKICEIDNVANIEEYTQTVMAGVQEYPIPQNVKTKIQIMNVRYLYGPETWQFVTLELGMIQDRFSYPTNIPTTYCIRNGKILLSPTPNVTRENALIINYQKRMRKLDYRRGKVSNIISPYGNITGISNTNPCQITTQNPHGMSSGMKSGISGVFEPSFLTDNAYIITVTGPNSFTIPVDTTLSNVFSGIALWYQNPVLFQLNFTVLSQKDANLQANANSILDKIDWICFTDRNGLSVIDAIPINSYNMQNFIITCDSNYVIPYESWLRFIGLINNQDTFYVLSGDYSSTHSQLDRSTEDLLIEYCVLRLLRLQSAAEPTDNQLSAERDVLNRIGVAYRRNRPSIVPIVWQQRSGRSSNTYGGRGCY